MKKRLQFIDLAVSKEDGLVAVSSTELSASVPRRRTVGRIVQRVLDICDRHPNIQRIRVYWKDFRGAQRIAEAVAELVNGNKIDVTILYRDDKGRLHKTLVDRL